MIFIVIAFFDLLSKVKKGENAQYNEKTPRRLKTDEFNGENEFTFHAAHVHKTYLCNDLRPSATPSLSTPLDSAHL